MALPPTVPYLGWRWDDLVFLVLAGVMLGSALLVVLSRNIIRSGLFMVLAFAGLAGLYALMGATLVAAAQVLVYMGAISVLILFAVMLTQSKSGPARLVFHHQAWAAAIAVDRASGVLLIMSVLFTTWPLRGARAHRAERSGRRDRSCSRTTCSRSRSSACCCWRRSSGASSSRGATTMPEPGESRPSRGRAARARGQLRRDPRGRRSREPLAGRLPHPRLRACSPSARSASWPSRNAIAMLMCVEIMLNAVNLAIVAFGMFTPALAGAGQVIALFVMAVAAAEATVGLAIVIAIYRNRRTPLVDEYASMRE